MPVTPGQFGYLPDGFKERYRRRVVDADPDVAYDGWHDEHWDGRIDANARPHTIGLRLQPVKVQPSASAGPRPAATGLSTAPGVRIRPDLDTPDVAIRNLRRMDAMLEKKRLAQTQHNTVHRIGRARS